MASSDPLDALREALALDPGNHRLRLMYAESLAQRERFLEAAAEYRVLLDAQALADDELVSAGRVALRAGDLELATAIAERARALGMEGAASLRQEIDAALGLSGHLRVVPIKQGDDPGDALIFEPDPNPITFADVGGLAEVKDAVNRTIILPLRRTELYARFGRRAGGGVLLYGPPGCGKTMLARATAGECQLPFLNIRIEDILNPFFGVSEHNLHAAFEQARTFAPCVMFIDELDAIGFARPKMRGGAGRPLVDQLLQELDAIGADNDGILILAATNAPWDVDSALKRPGRLDRTLFVSPPDEQARAAILDTLLRPLPTASEIDCAQIAKKTTLFSGADLRALVELAVDGAIDDSLETGRDQQLTAAHFFRALDRMRPTTLDWIATARRYVEFANHTGNYDDVERFLARKDVKTARA